MTRVDRLHRASDQSRSPHDTSLDGLRGAAAAVVVLYHFSLVFPDGLPRVAGVDITNPDGALQWLVTFPLRLLLSGPQAVILFFVLSGFVLSLSLARGRAPYRAFAVKRFFRIWPVFAVAILLSALLSRTIGRHPSPETSAWFQRIWASRASSTEIWQHLLMTETRVGLDNAMWSLIHELRLSFLFPALWWATRRFGLKAIGAGIVAMVGAGAVKIAFQPEIGIASYFDTIGYAWLFMAGCYLAGHCAALERALAGRNTLAGLILLGALTLLTLGPEDSAHVASAVDCARMVANGVGAAGILAVAAVFGRRSWLAGGLFQYLGRISYSLYLIHLVALAVTVNLLVDVLPLSSCVTLSVALSFLLADLGQRWVERPSARLGRRLAAALAAPRAPIRNATSSAP